MQLEIGVEKPKCRMLNVSLPQILTAYTDSIYILYMLLEIGVEKPQCRMSNVKCFSTSNSNSIQRQYIHIINAVGNWG